MNAHVRDSSFNGKPNDWISLNELKNEVFPSIQIDTREGTLENQSIRKVVYNKIAYPMFVGQKRKYSGKPVISSHLKYVAKIFSSFLNSEYRDFSYIVGLLHDIEDKEKSKIKRIASDQFHNPLPTIYSAFDLERQFMFLDQILLGLDKDEMVDYVKEKNEFIKPVQETLEQIIISQGLFDHRNLTQMTESEYISLFRELHFLDSEDNNQNSLRRKSTKEYLHYILSIGGMYEIPNFSPFVESTLTRPFKVGAKLADLIGNIDKRGDFVRSYHKRTFKYTQRQPVEEQPSLFLKELKQDRVISSEKEYIDIKRNNFEEDIKRNKMRFLVYAPILASMLREDNHFETIYTSDFSEKIKFFQNRFYYELKQ